MEAVVGDLMKEVLGGRKMSMTAKAGRFWELGGTSLMAMTLDGLIQRETGVRIGMARMMQDGSLEGMSRQIERERKRNDSGGKDDEAGKMTGTTAMPTRAMTRESDMAKRRQKHNLFAVVTAGQEGLYVIWKMDPSARNYDTGFTAKGVWAEEQQAFKAMSAIVARHSGVEDQKLFCARQQQDSAAGSGLAK